MWYRLLGNNFKHTEKLQYRAKNFYIPFTHIHQLLTFFALLTLSLCISTCLYIYTFFSYPFILKYSWVYFLRIRIFIHDYCTVKNFRDFNMDSLYRFCTLCFPVLSLMFLTAFFSSWIQNHILHLVILLLVFPNLEHFLSRSLSLITIIFLNTRDPFFSLILFLIRL